MCDSFTSSSSTQDEALNDWPAAGLPTHQRTKLGVQLTLEQKSSSNLGHCRVQRGLEETRAVCSTTNRPTKSSVPSIPKRQYKHLKSQRDIRSSVSVRADRSAIYG